MPAWTFSGSEAASECSAASLRKVETGIHPFRCACSSALGSVRRNSIWSAVREARAAAAYPAMVLDDDILVGCR